MTDIKNSDDPVKAPPEIASGETTPELKEQDTPLDFNEQTNYVPPRVIITVRQKQCLHLPVLTIADILGMRECRPSRSDGPNDACCRPHYRQPRPERQFRKCMDCRRLLPDVDFFPASLWTPLGCVVPQGTPRHRNRHLLFWLLGCIIGKHIAPADRVSSIYRCRRWRCYDTGPVHCVRHRSLARKGQIPRHTCEHPEGHFEGKRKS
jgi:hypothetical protein